MRGRSVHRYRALMTAPRQIADQMSAAVILESHDGIVKQALLNVAAGDQMMVIPRNQPPLETDVAILRQIGDRQPRPALRFVSLGSILQL